MRPVYGLLSSLLFLLVLSLLVPARAYAYGDPSGGFLFQVLTPILAALWGAGMILATMLRKRLSKLFGRIRRTSHNPARHDGIQDRPPEAP
jgi:hypothetical protein